MVKTKIDVRHWGTLPFNVSGLRLENFVKMSDGLQIHSLNKMLLSSQIVNM